MADEIIMNNQRSAEPLILPGSTIDSPVTIFSLAGLFIIGPMFFLLMPLYVGALADDIGLNHQQIGIITSLELVGSCLASLSGIFWVRRSHWRMLAMVCALLLAVMNLVSISVSDNYHWLVLLRVLAGFSSGCLLVIALAGLGDTEKLDRNFAMAVAGQLIISGGLFFILPQMIVKYGVNGFFGLLAVCSFAAVLLSLWVPARGRVHSVPLLGRRRALRPLWGWVGCTAFFIAQTAFWAFVERLGSKAGFTPDFIGGALGGSTMFGAVGALGMGWLAIKTGRFGLMVVAAMGQCICLLMLLDGFTASVYLIAAVLFQFCWNGWLSLQMANIAEVDDSGRFTALIGLFQALGVAIGPALASQLILGEDYSPVLYVGIGFVLLALLLFIPISYHRTAQASLNTN